MGFSFKKIVYKYPIYIFFGIEYPSYISSKGKNTLAIGAQLSSHSVLLLRSFTKIDWDEIPFNANNH